MINKILVLMPFLLLLLTGCGSATRETTLSLSKKGVLTQTIVEEWDQDYYNQSELEKEMETAVEANAKVTMKSFRIKNKTATATLVYESAEAYADFNGVTCFWGTAAEAVAAGYSLAGEYLDSNGNQVDLTTILNSEKPYHVMILTEPVLVEVPGKILCASPVVEIRDAKHAKVTMGRVFPETATEEKSGSGLPETGQSDKAGSQTDTSSSESAQDAADSSGGDGLQLWLDEPACIVYR